MLIPRPGLKNGPCRETCQHESCRRLRDIASSSCLVCGQYCNYRMYLIDIRTQAQKDADIWYAGFVHKACHNKFKKKLAKAVLPHDTRSRTEREPRQKPYLHKSRAERDNAYFGYVLWEEDAPEPHRRRKHILNFPDKLRLRNVKQYGKIERPKLALARTLDMTVKSVTLPLDDTSDS